MRILIVPLIFILLNVPYSSLKITLTTSKPAYNLGETVQIYGNLTLNNVIVADGLVAIQITSPNSQLYLLRTLETGTITSQNWTVEIVDVYTCDQQGSPKTSFPRGTTAYVKITWKNNNQTLIYLTVALYIEFPNNIPFMTLIPFSGTVNPGESSLQVSIPIPSDAPLGTCLLYANLYNDLPKNLGTAYCPEKSTSFTITSTGTLNTSIKLQQNQASSTTTNINLIFNLPRTNGQMGKYTVYATSLYKGEKTSTSIFFNATLIGDINHDGIVDIRDISIVGRAYGAFPGHERWNPAADLNNDEIIDIRDISIVGRDFGKSGTYYG